MAQRLPFPGLMRCLCFFIPGEVEGCRKLSCSNREGTVGTTALSPYLKWQRGCLIHSWKSLCFLSISWCLTANSQRPATQHSISEPLSCTAVIFIRQPYFAAYPCPVSEQTYGLIPCKTLSSSNPVVLPGKRQLQNCCGFCVTTGMGCRDKCLCVVQVCSTGEPVPPPEC